MASANRTAKSTRNHDLASALRSVGLAPTGDVWNDATDMARRIVAAGLWNAGSPGRIASDLASDRVTADVRPVVQAPVASVKAAPEYMVRRANGRAVNRPLADLMRAAGMRASGPAWADAQALVREYPDTPLEEIVDYVWYDHSPEAAEYRTSGSLDPISDQR